MPRFWQASVPVQVLAVAAGSHIAWQMPSLRQMPPLTQSVMLVQSPPMATVPAVWQVSAPLPEG